MALLKANDTPWEKLFDELEFNSLTRKLDQLKDTIRPEAQQALF